ncbi:unnamed protein product [Linum trigynum]|uniref:Uncharacterized protein n=1 Tax=Linum trigynum TaxID=586398 RepID=A0AAV2GHJ6_9ROSI
MAGGSITISPIPIPDAANDTHPAMEAPGHEFQPEWEDFMEAEDYLNDEEKFIVTSRLQQLFPKIRVLPLGLFGR